VGCIGVESVIVVIPSKGWLLVDDLYDHQLVLEAGCTPYKASLELYRSGDSGQQQGAVNSYISRKSGFGLLEYFGSLVQTNHTFENALNFEFVF
jgi:hypothetical protein